MKEPPEASPLQLVDAAGHAVVEGAAPGGTPVCWVHLGLPIPNCPVVLSLIELGRLSVEDDFQLPWVDRGWRQLPFEREELPVHEGHE